MEIELKLSTKISVATDDVEKAEILAESVAKELFPGFKYEGMSLAPELDYQLEEIKQIGLIWDDLMKSIFKTQ